MGSKSLREIKNNGEEKMKNYLAFKRFSLLLAICYMPYAIAGCGYTTRSMITAKYKTIYITPFMNKIDITQETEVARKYRLYRPFLETDITKEVVNKFLFDGNLKPIKSESADLVLKGELIEFRKDPLRYSEDNEVEEYRVNLVVNISLWDNKENKLIWQENNFTGDTSYFTTGSLVKTEAQAINDAIKDLARRTVERAVEEW